MIGRLLFLGLLSVATSIADPTCFRWGLAAGVRVIYQVDAADTIAIAGEPTLFRHREERWSVVCDSVRGDTLYLRQTLERYTAQESTSTGDRSVRATVPWIGQSAQIVMTRQGWRLQSFSPATDEFSGVPGGVFGPSLLVPLDSGCVQCNRTQWLVERRDTLVEYAYPPAVLERMYLASVDSCAPDRTPLKISVAETSRGMHYVRTAEFATGTYVSILAHGVIELEPHWAVPALLSFAQHIRFFIEHDNNKRRHGEQRTSLHARLVTVSASETPHRQR